MKLEQLDPRGWINGETGTERAVSPVIGVILMVAITVVLAGVIGIMVFGIADDLGDSTPSATLSIDDVEVNSTEELNSLTLEHDGGDSVVIEDLNLIVDGETIEGAGLDDEDELSAGESIDLDSLNVVDVTEDSTIRISHAPSDSVLATYDVQSNDIDD